MLAKKSFTWLMLGILLGTQVHAQKKEKHRISLRDSTDHAFDLSDALIDAHGFVPVPTLVTEPALGGIGGALGVVFLQKKKLPPGRTTKQYVPPDITMGMGMYTANNSWAAGGGRMGTIMKWNLRYRIFACYADVNMNMYKTLPVVGEQKFDFNFRMVPVYAQLSKPLGQSNFFATLGYAYLYSQVKLNNDGQLPSFVTDKEVKNTVSMLAPSMEYDNRDNYFTPNKGTRVQAQLNWGAQWMGSDYDFERLAVNALQYVKFSSWWVSGFRFEYRQMFGDVPFYLNPYVDLRGVPTARYQNTIASVLETEQRIRVYKRWSGIAFGGLGKAFADFDSFGDATLVYNYGGGFRYLVARKFGLHMGADVGFGPEDWGFYIVFGSSWLR
jgi:hypothetical protein